MLISFNTVKPV